MIRVFQYFAGSALLAFLFCGQVHAQEGAIARVDAFDFSGFDVVSRIVEHTYPVSEAPSVSILNRFGPVTVQTWDDAVVHLIVTIRVGAGTEEEAVRTAQLIDVATTHSKDRVDVRTEFPPTGEKGKGGFAVEYLVQVPTQTALSIENAFGDSQVNGVRGGTTIDSRYGVIELNDLAGTVRVRARGEFPLTAHRLEKGGYFFLRGTQASFRDIGGTLFVSNYLGSVTLHPLQVEEADVVSESGPIHVYLPEKIKPAIEARADFGRVESEMPLAREAWGRTEIAHLESTDATQHLALHAAFDSIHIYRPPSLAPLVESGQGDAELVQDELSQSVELVPDQTLRIDAAPGRLQIEGATDNRVSVVATRRASVRDIANARLALEGLALQIENGGPVLRVMTLVREDMEALGAQNYSVDLVVRCPAHIPVEVYANAGETFVSGLGGVVKVEQSSGSLTASGLSGTATLTAFNGSGSVTDSSGAVDLTVKGGDARAERVSGALTINVEAGRTVVDTPGASLVTRASGGDVRIVALEGVQGDFDVHVEQGSISLAVPETASATLFLNAVGGTVESAFPITGTMDRGEYRFQGRLNEGKHRVVLETEAGDIRVD